MNTRLSNIKVSVITPTYNDEKYITQPLDSILNQTHKNLELLIVDDCSTDKTVDIIKTYNDSRIRLYQNKKNSGAAFSRNKALKEASGDYIAFLDGDDVWDLTKIEKQLTFMIVNDFGFSCTFYYVVDENNKKTGKYISGPKSISHKDFMKMDYAGCLTVMYKRTIYPTLQIPNDIYKRNDYALWLKISEKSPCYCLSECLAYYKKRTSGSISSGSKFKLIKYHKELFEKLYGFSSLKSWLLAVRNAFYFFCKKIKYEKNID